MRVHSFVKAACVPRLVCVWCIGRRHTAVHRMLVGLVLIVAGVLIGKLGPLFGCGHLTASLVESFGTLVNALGVTPYIDAALEE